MRPWLQLLRAPNLLTVPGDPLAGFLLASGAMNGGIAVLDARAAFAVAAALALYSAGLVMNDLFDLEEDRRDRPQRPLASGAISAAAAKKAAAIFALIGIATMHYAAGLPGAALAALLLGCVFAYNAKTKRLPLVGALNMGVCRGLSVLLGCVAFAPRLWPMPPVVLVGAGFIALYIAAVTNLARHETQDRAPALARALPGVATLAFAVLAALVLGWPGRVLASTVFVIAAIFAVAECVRLFTKLAPPLPPVIGALIRVLLPLQAALCLVFAYTDVARNTAIALLVAMPVARLIGRRFYAS